MKLYVIGQAYPRDDVGRRLERRGVEVMRHLVKIWAYPDHVEVNHWAGEIYAFLPKVSLIKGKGVPDVQFVLDHTYKVLEAQIPGALQAAYNKHGGSPRSDDIDHLYEWVKLYFTWFAQSLDSKGKVSRSAVVEWITSHLEH